METRKKRLPFALTQRDISKSVKKGVAARLPNQSVKTGFFRASQHKISLLSWQKVSNGTALNTTPRIPLNSTLPKEHENQSLSDF